jgi:5-amino-6-(5-phosphoribosylamino)uracil reductase
MLRISPQPEKILDKSQLSDLYSWPEKPWLRANMVQTLDGSVLDSSGSTDSITNDIDKDVFRVLRQLSDVIIVGSKTAITNKYQDIKVNEQNKEIRKKLKLKSIPRLAIITNNFNLDNNFFTNWKDLAPPLIYTHESNQKYEENFKNFAEFNYCGKSEVDLKKVKKDLIQKSFKRLLCEGGPTLLNSMFQKNLIDELALTLQVKLSHASNLLKIVQGPLLEPFINLNPYQVIQHEKTLLLRYLVQGHRL